MTFTIAKHLLEGVRYQDSPNQSGSLPTKVPALVFHDTAGHLDTAGTVNWLCSPKARASAHLVVGWDGDVVQLVPFNRRAWHAGTSRWGDMVGMNSYSIGIELVNPGHLTGTPLGKGGRAWFGTRFEQPEYDVEHAAQSVSHPAGWWLNYSEPQLETATDLAIAICHEYGIEEILTHWMISPGRKIDTSPLFPLEHIKAKVFGRGDKEDEGVKTWPSLLTLTKVNQRAWPDTSSEILATIAPDTLCDHIRSGYFAGGQQWHEIEHNGQTGWVHGAYARLL